MAKFGKPLDGEIYITQTIHGSSNDAVDLSAVADKPVRALADGKIAARSSADGSYCTQSVTGSILRIYYVHTYKWLAVGTTVTKGQVICYIAPKSLNGGYATHLHLGLPHGYNIMDFFARDVIFRTAYADIKKSWFNNTPNLNWSLFKDLDYKTLKPIPVTPPAPPTDTECAKRLEILQDSFDSLSDDYRASQAVIKTQGEVIENQTKTLAGVRKELDDMTVERNTFENQRDEALADILEIKEGRFYWMVDFLERTFPSKPPVVKL